MSDTPSAQAQAEAAAITVIAENIMAGPLLGVMFSMILYGMTCLQAFFYFQTYGKDAWPIKMTVALAWMLETVHAGFCMHFVYVYLILHFAQPEALGDILWSMGGTVLVGVLVTFLVHCFFFWRVWVLSQRNIVLVAILFLVALARLGFGMASCALSFKFPGWVIFHEHALSTVTTGLILAAIIDIMIAVVLTWYLRARSKRTGMAKTDTMINRIIEYSIRTGIITTVFSILVVIVFLSLPSTAVFLGVVEIQSRLYANSLLATLNARESIRSMASGANTTNSISHVELGNMSSHQPGQVMSRQAVAISQETTVFGDFGEEIYKDGMIKGIKSPSPLRD